MKEIRESVGNPDTKGAPGARVSNRAVVAKNASTSQLSRMNPDKKHASGKSGKK